MKEFIEKLIGRLEELYARNDKTKKMAYEEQDWEKFDLFTHRCEGIYSAISIVDQLAEEYNNDFCEWFKYDYRTITPKYHDAENPYWRIPENLDKLKHCPYCGKKIKIAPYQPEEGRE